MRFPKRSDWSEERSASSLQAQWLLLAALPQCLALTGWRMARFMFDFFGVISMSLALPPVVVASRIWEAVW